MKTREELNTEIQIEMLAELQKLNEVSPVIDHHELKRAAYKKMMIPQPASTFGLGNVE